MLHFISSFFKWNQNYRKEIRCLTANIPTSTACNFNRWQMILFGMSVQWFIIHISATRGGEDLEKIKLKVAVISKNPRKTLRTFQPMLVNEGIWDMCLWVSFISDYQICWMCIWWLLVGKDDAEKTSDVTECGCIAYVWHCLSSEDLRPDLWIFLGKILHCLVSVLS